LLGVFKDPAAANEELENAGLTKERLTKLLDELVEREWKPTQ